MSAEFDRAIRALREEARHAYHRDFHEEAAYLRAADFLVRMKRRTVLLGGGSSCLPGTNEEAVRPS